MKQGYEEASSLWWNSEQLLTAIRLWLVRGMAAALYQFGFNQKTRSYIGQAMADLRRYEELLLK
ncbi:hypothetical protein DCC85_07700 [Paenibacillus sp. CAA11]|uniref:hypothetical protein n=1 Tax=Paenibacillus sp. CAA11 TaxID=1532905 RepID=UPI000D3A1357|nr:hypothetical protein [Paenibacillus sp. CAA11]AWB44113.1 hypothetical protein DCC85_07700 [Paenibacillus sp. CAA11]